MGSVNRRKIIRVENVHEIWWITNAPGWPGVARQGATL